MNSPFDMMRAVKARLDSLRQIKRLVQITFPHNDGPAGALLVVKKLIAKEQLSSNFEFDAELLSDTPHLELKDLTGKLVAFVQRREDGSQRFYCGHVFSFAFVKSDAGYAHYRMRLLPWFEFLRHREDNHIFHNQTLQAQLSSIFRDYAMSDWQVRDFGADGPMTFACQYGESDRNYADRRLEDRGLYYWHEHRADGYTLWLSGDSTAAAPIDGSGNITWQGESGVRDIGITRFSAERHVAPTAYSAASFDFKAPRRPLIAQVPTINDQGDVPPLEIYQNTGAYGFKNQTDGDALVRRRMEALEAAAKSFHAIGNDDHVQAGRSFTLRGHLDLLEPDRGEEDNVFLITGVTHTLVNNFETREGGEAADYKNEFTCIRRKIPWRPLPGSTSVRPRIHGVQTAICCCPEGREIWTDSYGRVPVKFHWDRVGRDGRAASALLRVARPVSGDRFGFIGTPRHGQELLITWLDDGNPDRPIIIGSLDNALLLPTHFDHEGNWPLNAGESGWNSRELGGNSLQQLIFTDIHGRPSSRLTCDHTAAQLGLGWLGTPVRNGQSQPLGEGVNLSTLAAAVVRAAQGLLLLTETNGAEGQQLARAELLASLGAASELARRLDAAARQSEADALDPAPQQQLKAHFDQLHHGSNTAPGATGGQQPVLGIGASAGLALTTPQSATVFTGQNLDIATQGHTQQSTNKRWLVNVGESIGWFVAGLADQAKQAAVAVAVKLIAARGKVLVQAQSDGIDLQAERDIDLGANGRVSINGKGGITLTEPGGAQIEMADGNITFKCTGVYTVHAASVVYTGAAGGVARLPSMPGSAQLKSWLGLSYLDPDTGQPIVGAPYEVRYGNGIALSGMLDGTGHAQHPDVPDATLKQVVYKPRTPQEDADAPPLDDLL